LIISKRQAAISQYVEREEKHESFRQDSIRAWKEYQATGLHVALEEADAWLGKLEDGQDVEQMPHLIWSPSAL
jgi:predicted transcriptional regulator